MLGRFTKRPAIAPEAGVEIAEPAPVHAPMVVLENAPEIAASLPDPVVAPNNPLLSAKLLDAKVRLHRRLIEEINLSALEKLPEAEIRRHVSGLVFPFQLNEGEQL
jgi:pilus assembly protein CpaF